MATYIGVKYYLEWSLKREIFDVPNVRSSHRRPTPVGGGTVFVLTSLILFLLYLSFYNIPIRWSYFAGAFIIASVSWLDDLYSIPVYLRFLCHGLAASFVIAGFGIPHEVYVPVLGTVYLGDFAYLLWFVWIIGLINAYNFMDGIDGIAGFQAVSAGIAWGICGYLQNSSEAGAFGFLIAAACAGFLFHNWQPAKIFMGDVGSAWLGYTFAVFPLFLKNGNGLSDGSVLYPAVLFLWLFLFDTFRTLLVRISDGEKIWQAHRRHLYQKLVIEGFAHSEVALLYGSMSVFFSFLTILKFYYGVFSDGSFCFIIFLLTAVFYIYSKYHKFFSGLLT